MDGTLLSLDISGQLRTVEPDQELAPLDHVSLPDQPFDDTPGDLDAHVHLGRLDGARHRDGPRRAGGRHLPIAPFRRPGHGKAHTLHQLWVAPHGGTRHREGGREHGGKLDHG